MATAQQQVVRHPVFTGDEATPMTRVTLPLHPTTPGEGQFETEVYTRFMGYLRGIANDNGGVSILSAIQLVSGSMHINPALAAKILVDLGLRAPREAFPALFLNWSDDQSMSCIADLRSYWSNS